jgi:hypothetical protein
MASAAAASDNADRQRHNPAEKTQLLHRRAEIVKAGRTLGNRGRPEIDSNAQAFARAQWTGYDGDRRCVHGPNHHHLPG